MLSISFDFIFQKKLLFLKKTNPKTKLHHQPMMPSLPITRIIRRTLTHQPEPRQQVSTPGLIDTCIPAANQECARSLPAIPETKCQNMPNTHSRQIQNSKTTIFYIQLSRSLLLYRIIYIKNIKFHKNHYIY